MPLDPTQSHRRRLERGSTVNYFELARILAESEAKRLADPPATETVELHGATAEQEALVAGLDAIHKLLEQREGE